MISQLIDISKRLKLTGETMGQLVSRISDCLTEADGMGKSTAGIKCGPYRLLLVVRRSGK